jgi:hypothetical protein
MRVSHFGNQCFFRASFLSGTNHDGCAVSIVGADVDAAMTSQILETDPDIRLDIFDQMAQVNMAIGVRQSRCDKNSSDSHASSVERMIEFRR